MKMNGLNALPGWRLACTARSNLLCLKLRPPTSARTRPVLHVDRDHGALQVLRRAGILVPASAAS